MVQAGPPPDDLEQKPKSKPQPAKRPSRATVTRRNLEKEIGEFLVVANIMSAPFTREDALDDAEIFALAKAMDAQAKKSERFRKLVEGALGVTGAGGLVGVVVMIAGRRLARHGAIAPVWDAQLELMLRLQTQGISPEDSEAMEAAMAAMAEQAAATAAQTQTTEQPSAAEPVGPIATPISDRA